MRILAGGQTGSDEPARAVPCTSVDHDTLVQQKLAKLRAELAEGGAVEAGIRALIYIHRFCSSIDERRANLMLELHQPDCHRGFDMASVRDTVRRQANIMRLDEKAAIASLPQLLARDNPARIREIADGVARMRDFGPLSTAEESSLSQMLGIFDHAVTSHALKLP